MIRTKSMIQFTTHTVSITVDHRGHIHVFKYSERSCDFDVFEDQDAASDFVLSAPADCYYRVIVNGDDDSII